MAWRQSSWALEEAWVSEPECPLTTHLGGRSEVFDDPAAGSGQGCPCIHLGACSKHGKTCGSEKPVDVQALRKKVSGVTCGPAARAVLSSLLLYITDLQDRPPEPPPARRAEGRESRAGHSPESRDAHRRPTCFQLLQAKFMGTGREPRPKKAREVGRLIAKDRQGPGGSLVTATINKLLDKAREGSGRPTRDRELPPSQKPRQGLPAGKGAVKNILKIFLAAEKKEVCEEPTAARGPLPKPTKRGSMLSKLREKFEQSGCLCSEAGVLPLCAEGRRRKNPARRKTHRPETRVLSTAAIASTCLGTPLARFLACTAEPALAFSIATVVCGPRSWLSHCAKISHSRQGRVPRGGTGASPSVGVIGDGQGQPGGEPTQPPAPWATALGDSLEMAFLGEGAKPIPGLAPSPASHKGGPLPGHEPAGSLLKPASPGRARAVGGDGMGNPPAGDTARHTMAPGEAGPGLWPGLQSTGAGVAPKFALTVCSSEDEAEGVSLGSEEDPLFALQETFPERKVGGHIPPLPAPAVQALQDTQSALESPQITVTRPVMYQMPPPAATLPKAVASPHVTVPRPDPCQGPPPAATLPKAVASPHVTVPRPDPCQGPPPAATLPKAVASPHVTVPRPDPCQGPPPAATLPKAVASPHVTVPRPDPCQGPPPAATLPKAVASPHVTVPRPDPCQGPPPAATLPKAVASPHVTVPRPDPCQGPPPAATLPKAVASPHVTVPRPDPCQGPPPAATLPKAVASPHVTVPRPDPCQGPPPAATLPKAVASPHVTVPRPDPCQGPPPAATLPKAVASPHVTVPRPDPCQGPPPAATLPKAVASPHVTVPRPDPCQGPPPAATLPKAVASPHVTVPRPDPCQGPPPAATLPKAVASPHVTVPRPDPCQGPPPAATLPKAVASPHVTVPRPDPCQGPPPAATLPKAVASPHVTVPRPDPCQGPPPAATLPKAVASPHVTVPRPDPCQGPPPAATLPKAVASPHVTVPRPDPCQGPPATATLPKAMESPHVTVPRPDMCQVPTPPATLPKAVASPHVTVPRPDPCQMPPGLATLPQASGGGDRGSSLLSSEGRGRGGLESARGAFPMGTGSENIRAASTVGGPLQVLSVPPARGAASTGQDLPAAAAQRPTQGMANTHSFGDSKELRRPEGPVGEDVSEPAGKKRQRPASGDRPVHGRDAPWHRSVASGNRRTGDSPSAPDHQRELPTQAGHPAGASAALGATPSDRTQSDSSTTGEEKVLCGRELGGLPRGDAARPGAQAAGSTSSGLGSDRHGPLRERPQPAPGAPRREAATRATESHTAPEAGNVLKSVDSTARGRDLVQEPGCCPPPVLPSLAAVALTRAPSPPHSSAPPRRSEHLLENSTGGGSGQRWPEPPESPAAVPLQAADTPLRPAEPRASVVAESKASVVAGGRGAPVAHGSPQGGIMTRIPGGAPPTPQGSAAVGPPPSGNQQAEEDKHVLPKAQVPPRAGAPCQPPPPRAAGGQRVAGAPQKGPDPRAHPPSVPLMRAGGQDRVEVGDGHQPRAGLGALEEGATGPLRLDGPPDRRGALWSQKSGPQAAEVGQTQPREVKVGRGAEVGATEVGTGHPCTEKGPEHARGQRSRPAERPPWGHSAQAGENQEPSPPEKPGHPAQAQAGRTAARIVAGPADNSSEAVSAAGASRRSCRPAPGGSQAEAGAPHQVAESQPVVGRSLWSSGPEPAPDSTGPTPKPGGCEMPCAPAQEGPPEVPEAESGAWEPARRRRLAHFAKYRAQSFGDQRSFDLSFRPTTIRANDTFELPK